MLEIIMASVWVVAASLRPRPTLHAGGTDEMLCLVVPLVIIGIVFLLSTRNAPAIDDGEEEAEVDAVQDQEEPRPGSDA